MLDDNGNTVNSFISDFNYRASGLKLPVAHASGLNESPVLALDDTGIIQKCSESCELLFGYPSQELVTQPVSWLFPQLSGITLFVGDNFNPRLDFLCHCGHLFQAQNKQGVAFKSELSFVRIENNGQRSLRLIVRPLKNELFAGVLSHVQTL